MNMNDNNTSGSKPYRLYKTGAWELYIFYSAKGTKSEGPFGVLLQNGNLIFPFHQTNAIINTDLGEMKYYGVDSEVAWAPKGWLFADKHKIPRSS